MGLPHTKAKNACCTETLVTSQVSVRNDCLCVCVSVSVCVSVCLCVCVCVCVCVLFFFFFTSFLVSTFRSHLLWRVLFSLRRKKIISHSFLHDFYGLIFPTISFRTRRFALYTRSHKVNSVVLPIRNRHGHTSFR